MSLFLRIIAVGFAILSFSACDDNLAGGLKRGELAPRLPTKTLADVGGDMSKITTYRQPDARMYQYSLDKALALGKPIVLEFATPGHCTVCDGQLQRLKALMDKYPQVLFLHMDQYENPEAFIAYRVKGDPWTFIIDDKGVVRFQRPGSMLYGEMEMAIMDVLKPKTGSTAG
ncbi:MAG TPA: thioredoxin family protein [Gallionellaceae bacterium]|nr:thioredoxin family protein [Gallionellaceae bacterium]